MRGTTPNDAMWLQGFLLKAQASKYKPSHWDFEAESLAIMGRAGLLFSIGIRCFFGFGILVSCIMTCLLSTDS